MTSRFILPLADVGNGIAPSAGAKLEFFDASNPTVQKNTFSDAAGIIANANPVIADGDGLFPAIFIAGSYNVTLTDKDDVQTWQENPVKETLDFEFKNQLFFNDYTEMQGLDIANNNNNDGFRIRFRTTEGDDGGGFFYWDSSDNSAKITADPQFGIFVPPTSDLTGASGAYVRDNVDVIKPEWFGAVGDGVTSDQQPFFYACRESGNSGKTLVLSGSRDYFEGRVEVQKSFDVQGNGAKIWFLGLGVTLIGGAGSGVGATPTAWPFNQFNDLAETMPGLNDPNGDFNPVMFSLASNATAGEKTVTLTDATGLSVGDLVFLADESSSASSTNNYIPKIFEFNRIVSISTNILTFAAEIKESYTTAGGLFFTTGFPINCNISNVKITTNIDAFQYVVRSAYNCQLDNIEFAGLSATGAATFCENMVYHNFITSSSFGPISQARGTVSAFFLNSEHRIRTSLPTPEDNSIFIEESFYNIYVDRFTSNAAFISVRQLDMSGVATKRTLRISNSTFDTRFADAGTTGAIQNGSSQGCDIIFDTCVIATADESTPPSGNYPGITGDAHNWHASSDAGDLLEFRACSFYSTISTSADTAFKVGSGFLGTINFDKFCTFETLSLDDTFTERGATVVFAPTSPVTNDATDIPSTKFSRINKTLTMRGVVVLNSLAVNATMGTLPNFPPEVDRFFPVAALVTGGGSWSTGTILVKKTSGIITWLGSQDSVEKVSFDGVEWQTV